MSQEAVERVLGRLITDERFRQSVVEFFEAACLQEGYSLTPTELRLLSGQDFKCISELADRIDRGLCRAGNNSDQSVNH